MTCQLPMWLTTLLCFAFAFAPTTVHAAQEVTGDTQSVTDEAPDSESAPPIGKISPTAFLQDHDAASQRILEKSEDDSLSAEFREVVRAHIFSAFDFDELSRLSLGSHWAERTAEERSEFVHLSTRLVEEQNLDTFVSYYRRGATVYNGETVNGSTASVTATVPLEKGDQVEITYHLHRLHGEWRVFDLAVDGSGTADGNRRRYARHIKKKSYESLIQMMNKQLDRLIERRTNGAN